MNDTKISRCFRCFGTGRLEWARHYADGVCFACKGTGFGVPQHAHDGVISLQVGKLVWQFCPTGETINEFGVNLYTVKDAKPGDPRVVTVLVQCFPALVSFQTGRTLLRCRISPEAARSLFRAAEGGRHPDDISNAEIGLSDNISAAWMRNFVGIESL